MRSLMILLSLVLAGPGMAQTVTGAQAAQQVFAFDTKAIQISAALNDKDHHTIKALIPLMEQQMQGSISYYSSIAYAPDQGLVSDALQGAFNHHSPRAADQAALRACTAAKPRGAGACRIAARILPRGFQNRALSLSATATRALQAQFLKLPAPRVFAISPSTGAWGLGRDERTAINGCRRAGARDCRAVIRN